MEYTRETAVTGEFDAVVDATIAALGDEGFGVLSDIDIQATLEAKLGEEFRQYRILGACNPPLAHDGLTEEIELGALLPCNVIVYESDEGDVVVSAVDPKRLLAIADNDALDPIGAEVTERIDRVLAAVAGEFESVSED
ncbi:DUF302 domain-containing protein [Halorubrum sp. CBA1229]|jgi:uncharacterized protein (DUF302 family)|uniref:DUF302 domain-containing protein n=1 Tax=Halorubrum sp. CBA1229 TaxID=1853699 RepID=UPI000F3B35DD|nr:DUF302 domain-containing protein [Halorubrum sp. CBA1229]QKY15522.1 DUF302 domain-containing protein [Halorubrum sp. CBA1229]